MSCQVVEIMDVGLVSGWCQMDSYVYMCMCVREDLATEYLGVIVIMNTY